MFSANTCSEHFFAIFSPLFQNLTELEEDETIVSNRVEANTFDNPVSISSTYTPSSDGYLSIKVGATTTAQYTTLYIGDKNNNNKQAIRLVADANSWDVMDVIFVKKGMTISVERIATTSSSYVRFLPLV